MSEIFDEMLLMRWCRRWDNLPITKCDRVSSPRLRDASSGAVSMTPIISWESQEDYESRALTRLGHCGTFVLITKSGKGALWIPLINLILEFLQIFQLISAGVYD